MNPYASPQPEKPKPSRWTRTLWEHGVAATAGSALGFGFGLVVVASLLYSTGFLLGLLLYKWFV